MGSASVDTIISQALQMPTEERALIAEKLISSLDDTVETDVEVAWQEEVQRRISDVERGTVHGIPWEKVRQRLRNSANAEG